MAHRRSQSMSRASLDASLADVSVASIAALSEAGSESLSEMSQLGPNKNAIAYLVYHNRGDPYYAGYKQPTTRDIPQVKLPRVDSADALEVDAYLKQLQSFERSSTPDSVGVPAPPPLDSVPSVFFDEDFHLDNPRVFDAVMSEDSSILQEKLSWYVDVVEAHLEKEIAAASSQFFSTTASFHAIETQAAVLARQIASFKSLMDGIQTGVMDHYQETARLQNKLHDLDAILAALDQLCSFTQAVDSLAPQDPATVLDHAAKARGIAAEGIDLARVTVTRSYFEKLDLAENQARSDASGLLVNALLADLRSEDPNSVNIDAARTLTEHAGVTEQALVDYGRAVDAEVRGLVIRQLPGANDDESQGLARSLHMLSAEDAEQMCAMLFYTLKQAFERLQRQQIPMATIQNAVKGADSRLARVLRVRKDPVTLLDVSRFGRFFSDVTQFCDDCEAITNIRPTELSEFLVAQTKLYIHSLHNRSDEDLVQVMNKDDWRPDEVPADVQGAASVISSSGSMDPTRWDLVLERNGSSKSTGTQRVIVDGQHYAAAKSIHPLLKMIVAYLQLICILPSVYVPDTASALLELLRLFNHKSHQQILGFGARTTANLRHISVKNLMLTSESLRLIHTLISPAKRCTERHLPSSANGLLESFDAVQQSYYDHRVEIESKLIKLMSDKVVSYARQIAGINWAIRQPEANRYMQGLMSDTTKVARVAQEMLPQQLAQNLIASIFSAYKPALLEAYGGVEVANADEKENVLRDLRFFQKKEASINQQSRSADVVYESVRMFVGPDIPEREPDLAVGPDHSGHRSPRISTESGLSRDPQFFPAAVAQGIAQAEVYGKNSSTSTVNVDLPSRTATPANVFDISASDISTTVDSSGEPIAQQQPQDQGTLHNGRTDHQTEADQDQGGPNSNVNVGAHGQEAEASMLDGEPEARKLAEEAEAKILAEEREAEHSADRATKAEELAEEAEARSLAEGSETKLKAEDAEAEAEAKRLVEEAHAKEIAEEAEAKRLAEEEKELAEEAEAKRLAEDIEAKRLAEEAEAKKLAEEAEAKRLAEEAEARRLAEEAEARRLAEEAEAKKLAEEVEAKRLAEEVEAKRLAEEVEAKRLAEEAEAKRLAEEAEAKKLAEEAEAKKLAEEAEAKRLAEEAEAKKLAEEAEANRLAEEAESKRLAEEAEAKKSAEGAEVKRSAEEAEAERLTEESEAKKLAEEAEANRLAEEAESKRLAEEAEAKKSAEEAGSKSLAEEAEAKESVASAESEALAENVKRPSNDIKAEELTDAKSGANGAKKETNDAADDTIIASSGQPATKDGAPHPEKKTSTAKNKKKRNNKKKSHK